MMNPPENMATRAWAVHKQEKGKNGSINYRLGVLPRVVSDVIVLEEGPVQKSQRREVVTFCRYCPCDVKMSDVTEESCT